MQTDNPGRWTPPPIRESRPPTWSDRPGADHRPGPGSGRDRHSGGLGHRPSVGVPSAGCTGLRHLGRPITLGRRPHRSRARHPATRADRSPGRSPRWPGPARTATGGGAPPARSATAATSASMSPPEVPRPALARTAPGTCRWSPRRTSLPVGVDVGVGHPEQAHHVGVGAEAAMAHRDPVLGAEPGRHQGVVHALDGEGGHRQGLDVRAVVPSSAHARSEQPDPVDGTAARPAASVASSARGRAMASQPMLPSASMAACMATAPTTLGEPASSRSGGAVQITSSSPTRSTAPPPARNGSPSRTAGPRPDQRARRRRGIELVAAEGHVVRRGGRGRCGASWAASTTTGMPRSWAASMMASRGGSQPVTLEAPVMASSAGRRRPRRGRRPPLRR